MRRPVVKIQLDQPQSNYAPGATISGSYEVIADDATAELADVEVSILWYTRGKGDEDLGVHAFERHAEESRGRFSEVLPATPLSYAGRIVQICWCVRVRAFFRNRAEASGQAPFQLGAVPPANAP